MNIIWQQARKPCGPFGDALVAGMALSHAAYYTAAMRWLSPGMRLLEIGPGSGSHVRDLLRLGIKYVGIDHSPDVIKLARNTTPGATFICGDAGRLDLPPCDAVLMVNVVQWLDAPVVTLINARCALVRGGLLIIGTPDRDCPRRVRFDGMPVLSADELSSKIVCAGFREAKIIRMEMPEMRYLFGVGSA